MGYLISQNTVKECAVGSNIVLPVDILRINSAWYTLQQMEESIGKSMRPVFVDVHTNRTKGKVTDHDPEMLIRWLGEHGASWAAISRVESAEVLLWARKLLKGSSTKICAKIESEQGYIHLEEIIQNCDGIMVDTEDLAAEVTWPKATQISHSIYDTLNMINFPWFKLKGVIFETGNYSASKAVYTYGVFDLLHPNHIQLLTEAKALGTKLIVGVVGDMAVKALKGNDRPIQPYLQRCTTIAALKMVDEVVVQPTYDPLENVLKYGISVIVKGADYPETIPGEDIMRSKGIQVVRLPYYPHGYSTTKTVKKIRGGDANA